MKGKLIANRYRIEEELGQGSMSLVYRALDTLEKKHVAVKILGEQVKARQLESILRFRREAVTMSGLSHPYIAKVYEVGEEEGKHYIVMEFIKGEELVVFRKKNVKVRLDSVLEIVKQISSALDYVHSKGIIHRDLKPGNIMVSENGTKPVSKILDFGLARLINIAEITEPDVIIGTFPYMSPEQTGLVDWPIDERSDLYSLGIIFYELATGELPFKGTEIGTLIHQHLAKVPARTKEVNPEIPVMIDKIIMKLLQKEQKDRYQTARGLIYDLERAQELVREDKIRIEKEFQLGVGDRIRGLSYRTRLIGREDELKRLRLTVDKAAENIGCIELIGGEAGVGKTRLCNELRDYVRAKGGIFISGRSYEYKISLPYNPFKEALDEYLNTISRFPNDKRRRCEGCVKTAVGELGKIAAEFSPPMKEILGEVTELVKLEPDREKERFLSTISNLFIGISTPETPLVIFIDDLQWTDGGSLELLNYLAAKILDFPILIMATYRSGEISVEHPLQRLINTWEEGGIPMERQELRPLGISQSEEMVSEMLGQEISRIAGWEKDILTKTEGNPFFIGETIRSLADGEIIRLEDGSWRVSIDRMEEITISATVTDIILKRMNRLSRNALEVLTLASAIGKQFSFDVLLDIASQDANHILDILDEGLNLRLIIESGGIVRKGYNFVHDRVMETLYNRIDISNRQTIHFRIGQSLEKVYGKYIETVIYDLANHFIQSGNHEKIIQYAIMAGDKAKSFYANLDAKRFYETTLPLLSPQSPHYTRTKEYLCDIYILLGENQKAMKNYNGLLDSTKIKSEKARFEAKIADIHFREGDLITAIEHHRKGLEYLGMKLPKTNLGVMGSILVQVIIQLFHSLFPVLFLARRKASPDSHEWDVVWTLMRLEFPYYFIDLNRCLDTHFRAINIAELLGESRMLSILYSQHSISMGTIPLYKRAMKYHGKALKMAERLKDRWGLAYNKCYLGLTFTWTSQWDKGIPYLKEADEELTRLGDPWEGSMAIFFMGYAYFMKGQFQKSVEYLKRNLDIVIKVSDKRSQGHTLNVLGTVLYLQGDIEKGKEYVEKAIEYARSSNDNQVVVMALKSSGYIYLCQGDYDRALQRLEESSKMIRQFRFRGYFVMETYINLARAYLGDIEEFRKLSRRKKIIKAKKIKKALFKAISMARKYRNHLGHAYRVAGQYYWAMGKKKNVLKYMHKSIAVCKQSGAQYELGLSYYELGKMC